MSLGTRLKPMVFRGQSENNMTSHAVKNLVAYLLCLCLTPPAISGDSDDVITIAAVGDLYIGGSAAPYLKQRGYSYPFESNKYILKTADITVVNLEAPLTNNKEAFMNKEYVLKMNPDAASAMRDAGFNVATLANNHIMDYGVEGLKDTITSLANAGIDHAGAGENLNVARKPATKSIKGKNIAFLAYSKVFPDEFYATDNSAGTVPGLFEYIMNDIKKTKQHYDIIVVSFHWGEELMKYPKDYQIKLAHLAIDSGANLIIGHHPHVVQGIERYNNGLIFYSLGNFAFGSVSRSAPEGIVASVKFGGNAIISAEVTPLNVDNKEILFQPKALLGEKAEAAIRNIQEISTIFKVNLAAKDGKGYIKFDDKLRAASLR